MATKTLADRLWPKVLKTEGWPFDNSCWLFTGSLDGEGYGRIRISRRKVEGAHRLAWRLSNGSIPDGQDVLHWCDVRRCCRPDHLFLGTQADNNADMVGKQRHSGSAGEQHGMAKLTAAQVAEIRAAYVPNRSRDGRLTRGREALARRFDVSVIQIQSIQIGRAWRDTVGVS